jgi:hypothetical protein
LIDDEPRAPPDTKPILMHVDDKVSDIGKYEFNVAVSARGEVATIAMNTTNLMRVLH